MLNKIKNNLFVKSTLILLFGGILGKIVGFFIRIIITRSISIHTLGLYSLIGPSMSLLSVLAIFSYSNAISKFISESSSKPKDLFLSIIPVSIIINVVFIIVCILFGKLFVVNLLHEEVLYYPFICISLTMPFISISAIIKGYFWGKQNMSPYMYSNFVEQIVRLILIVLFLDKMIVLGEMYTICFIILINIIGEISSWIIMIKYMPKFKLKISDFKIKKQEVIKTFKYCIPSTLSKVVGSISYFLEPIILTNILLYVGYTKDYITSEYGIINAYSLSLLLLPQFFTQNTSTSLIPELSKHYKNKDYKLCKRRINQIIFFSLLIGIFSTTIIFLFPEFFLKLLYNTTKGVNYIKLLSFFTILFYIEGPLINSLNAICDTREILKITLVSSSIRIISIIVFSLLKIGMYSLIISIIIYLIVSTLLYYLKLYKLLNIR